MQKLLLMNLPRWLELNQLFMKNKQKSLFIKKTLTESMTKKKILEDNIFTCNLPIYNDLSELNIFGILLRVVNLKTMADEDLLQHCKDLDTV